MKKIVRTMKDFQNEEIDFNDLSNVSGGTGNNPHDLFADTSEPYTTDEPIEEELD